MSWIRVTGRDVRLEALDFGGEGPGVLLLHGLAGTAREWEETAAWLAEAHRVVALDQRGHGRSERRPADVSRAAFIGDALAAVEQLGLAPVVLIGQSLGAQTAFLVAAARPDLVRGLVVAEATPAADPAAAREVGEILLSWPATFPTREAALGFFGGDSLRAQAWVDNLEESEGGISPAFEADVLAAAITAAAAESYWAEWAVVSAPCLIVRGESGEVSEADAEAMAEALPSAEITAVPGGHDVHLDAPEAWRAAVEPFLARLS